MNKSTNQRGFYVSATGKSSGKTVLSLGMARAIAQDNKWVQAFKKGPDYIDPMWHQLATGRACYNLDYFTHSEDEIMHGFELHRAQADIVYVEGTMGLFDGLDPKGADCNAALASMLGLPVVLIRNAQGMARGIAALLKGYETFAQDMTYAGVVLNAVAGSRHQAKLVAAVEAYTDMPVLGALPRSADLHLQERHLGLVPRTESEDANAFVDRAAGLVAENLDIDALLARATCLEPSNNEAPASGKQQQSRDQSAVKIGIARDSAFSFYYPDDLDAFAAEGAELIAFSPLQDQQLPAVDALFIGGGFPETHLDTLSGNIAMRAQIKTFIDRGGVVYAECGGLMYLCKEIVYQGQRAPMVGAIDSAVQMTTRPVGRGYAKIQANTQHPWLESSQHKGIVHCHEFHYSRFDDKVPDIPRAYRIHRGHGIDGGSDGLVINNTLANYCHLRSSAQNPWVEQFVAFVRKMKDQNSEHKI